MKRNASMLRGEFGNAQHTDIRRMFGLPEKAKLPTKGMSAIEAQGWTLYIRPLERKGRKLHRARAICPTCKKDISAGRTHQHACKV